MVNKRRPGEKGLRVLELAKAYLKREISAEQYRRRVAALWRRPRAASRGE